MKVVSLKALSSTFFLWDLPSLLDLSFYAGSILLSGVLVVLLLELELDLLEESDFLLVLLLLLLLYSLISASVSL